MNLAQSVDGLHFEELGRVVVERGGVPCLIADYEKGRIVAMFQNHSKQKAEEFDKIAVTFSYDEGETWTTLQVLVIEGLPEDTIHTWDPALVLLEDGRYRLYFTCILQGFKSFENFGSIEPHIVSAISNDCINFRMEEGERMMIKGEVVNDPSVIKIGDTWHYYSPFHTRSRVDEQAVNYHAVSKDGLTFTREEDIVLGMKMLGNASAVEGGYRFFAAQTAFSTDGYNWTQEDVRMPGPDPGVVRLKDGTYLLLYTAPLSR